jgi:signal transduction histidine kinase
MNRNVEQSLSAVIGETPSAGHSQGSGETERTARGLRSSSSREYPGAPVLAGKVEERFAADSRSRHSLNRLLSAVNRVFDEGRMALHGFQTPLLSSRRLEHALCDLLGEIAPNAGPRFRIVVTGEPKTLRAAVQEQIYLIGREALVNAFRHSAATSIEAEVQYSTRRLRVVVRDNGRGIEPKMLNSESGSHCGLQGMLERARAMGARFHVWSRPGSGTEVELSLPFDSSSMPA